MKHSVLIIFFLVSWQKGWTQNAFWVQEDKIAIKKFIQFYKKDSLRIGDFFEEKLNDTTFWGKGYYSVEKNKPVGYIHIRGTFFYLRDSLVGYKLYPELPNERELKSKYKSWYSKLFQFTDTFTLNPIYLNYKEWIKPLPQYNGIENIDSQSDLFKFFFSIESGNVFGCENGWGGYHKNCQTYIELLPTLNQEKVYLLMFSKNAITRMTAFYYFLNDKSEFKNKEEIEIWMDEILKNHPKVRCAFFDHINMCDPKEKLNETIQMNQNDG